MTFLPWYVKILSMKNLLFKLNKKYPRLMEIARFIIVGGLATVIDFAISGIFWYFTNREIYPHFYNIIWGATGEPSTWSTVVGTALGFGISLIVNYLLSLLFVFEEKGDGKSIKGALLFLIFSLIGLGIHMLGMYLLFDLAKLNEWLIKISLTIVVLVFNYVTRKLFIFNDKKTKSETDTNNLTEEKNND